MSIQRTHRFVIDFCILFITSYFLLQKLTGISFSSYAVAVLQPSVVAFLLKIAVGLGCYVVVAKLYFYCLDYFRVVPHDTLSSTHLQCLLRWNMEISRHLNTLFAGKLSLERLAMEHAYEDNLQFLHKAMVSHLLVSLREKKIVAEDIFVSVFHEPTFQPPDQGGVTALQYASHFDPTLHDTDTLTLDSLSDPTRRYAGTRAFTSNKIVLCSVVGKGPYIVGKVARRRSLRHFMGVPIRVMGKAVAVLNIEFHNKVFFKNDHEIKDFYRREIQAFVYMYEYQMNKKYFFHHLHRRATP